MDVDEFSDEIIDLIKSRPSKRAKIVIKHIIENGFITTEELEKEYGYSHPPRAARDVREAGIPLVTFRVKSSDGRHIAAYKFGDLSKIKKDRLNGRKIFSKKLKDDLYIKFNGKCGICFAKFEVRYFQIDHRIPYEISGDITAPERKENDYMLLCASCNRAKLWSCEHCPNWIKEKSLKICFKCYWASPEDYSHTALREIRRIDIFWDEDEIAIYEELKKQAKRNDFPIPDYVKKIIGNSFKKKKK